MYANQPMESMENSETDPSMYEILIYDKIVDQWGKEWVDFSIHGAGARDCSYERE